MAQSTTYGRCYWCDRKIHKGFDVFEPLTSKQQSPSALLTPPKVSPATKPVVTSATTFAPPSSKVTPATLPQLVVPYTPPLASPLNTASSSKPPKPIIKSPRSQKDTIIRLTVGTSLATGGVFWLIRAILGSLSGQLNNWVLYYPPEVTHFPLIRIPPENLLNVIQRVQWVCAGFGVFMIGVIIILVYWRKAS